MGWKSTGQCRRHYYFINGMAMAAHYMERKHCKLDEDFQISFDFMDEGEGDPVGFKYLETFLVFGVKINFIRKDFLL